MRVEIDRDDLLMGLRTLAPIFPRRAELPVVQYVLVEAAGDLVTLTADNLAERMSVRVPAVVHEAGRMLLPRGPATSLARELPRLPAELSDAGGSVIRCGHGEFRIETLPVSEFPDASAAEFAWLAQPAASTLATALRTALAFTADYDHRPVLSLVSLQAENADALIVVATNGHRLAEVTIVEAAIGVDFPALLLTPTACLALTRSVGKAGKVEIASGGDRVRLRWDRCELVQRAQEGPYPNYRNVIPKENDKWWTVSRADLLGAAKRALVLADRIAHRTTLSLTPEAGGVLECTASGNGGAERIGGTYAGDPLRIGVNAQYLADLLARAPGETVALSFSGPERAISIAPTDVADAALRFRFLLMPFRLLDERRKAAWWPVPARTIRTAQSRS